MFVRAHRRHVGVRHTPKLRRQAPGNVYQGVCVPVAHTVTPSCRGWHPGTALCKGFGHHFLLYRCHVKHSIKAIRRTVKDAKHIPRLLSLVRACFIAAYSVAVLRVMLCLLVLTATSPPPALLAQQCKTAIVLRTNGAAVTVVLPVSRRKMSHRHSFFLFEERRCHIIKHPKRSPHRSPFFRSSQSSFSLFPEPRHIIQS